MPKDVTVSVGHSCVINHPQTWRLKVTAIYFTLDSVGWWFRLPHSYMYAGWFWFWGLSGCWLLGWWGNQAQCFSSPAGWPGLVHTVVANSKKQSRSDQGLLRPRPGTGTTLFLWHCIAKSQNQTDSQGWGSSFRPMWEESEWYGCRDEWRILTSFLQPAMVPNSWYLKHYVLHDLWC